MGMLDEKVAIVTSATSGTGKRIAEIFVEDGTYVVMAAPRDDEDREVQEGRG